jgi:hypothetical protein
MRRNQALHLYRLGGLWVQDCSATTENLLIAVPHNFL